MKLDGPAVMAGSGGFENQDSFTMRMLRFIKMPTFLLATAVAISTLCARTAWAFFDASFSDAESLVLLDLRLKPIPEGWDIWSSHGWDILPRFGLYLVLATIGVGSLLLMFYLILRGTTDDRRLSRWFVAVTVVGLWLAYFVWNERVQDLGFQWRMRRLVAGLKSDLTHLLADWPAEGELPYLGKFIVDDETLIPSSTMESISNLPLYPIREPIWFIHKTDDGGISVTVFSGTQTTIDYRPDDRAQPVNLEGIPADCDTTRVEPYWFVERIRVN